MLSLSVTSVPFLLNTMTSRQCSFSNLLNPDWSIQISGVPAICKVVRYIFNGRVYTQNFTIIAKGDYMLDIQARVVRKVDNAIQRINHYLLDSVVCFVNTYPLDSDLSCG